MEDLEYDFLIISAYEPDEFKKMGNEKKMSVLGLYDGDQFLETVKCPECEKDMRVIFNVWGEPEKAQCMSCSIIRMLYYKKDTNYLGGGWEVARLYKI